MKLSYSKLLVSAFALLFLLPTLAHAQRNVAVQMNSGTQATTWNPTLDFAVFAFDDFEVTGSSRILGSIGTNSTASATVRLNSWGSPNVIQNDVYLGTGGNPATVITSPNPNSIGGSVFTLPAPRSYPMPDFPVFPAKDVVGSSVNLSGSAALTLNPADYAGKFIPEIRIQNNTVLTIDLGNEDRVFHIGKLRIDQGHIRFINRGTVILLVEEEFTMLGSSTINETGTRDELFMFYQGATMNFGDNTRFRGSLFAETANLSFGGSNGIEGNVITGGTSVNITGNVQALTRAFYAPNATFTLANSGNIRGAVVAKTFSGTGNVRVTYESVSLGIPDIGGSNPTISVSGAVFNDINGLTNGQVDGASLSQINGNQLHVSLLDVASIVVATASVNPDGTYTFTDIEAGNYEVMLSLSSGTVGQQSPARELTGNWVYVSDVNGTAGTPANNNGLITFTAGLDNLSGLNFGIQQRPIANGETLIPVPNPGSSATVDIPSSAFTGNDFDGGTITSIRITAFPTNSNVFSVGATQYTIGTFPAAGVTVTANAAGNPLEQLSVMPVDGEVTITIPFVTIDNANTESITGAVVSQPLSASSSPVTIYFPASGFGTLAFEDSWPGKGDYDFNDVVVDYQFEIDMNASNFVDRIKATFVLRAFGAGYQNGFGFQLSSAINASSLNVTGFSLTENIITLNQNGTEAGQNRPTIIVFDNAFNEMQHPGIGIGVNTEMNAPHVQPKTYSIIIEVPANTYTWADLDIISFNPFIIVDLDRGREVHLPGFPPTSLANSSYFGTLDDASNIAQGRTYVTDTNLPWAINTYQRFEYPIEKEDIIRVHLKFVEWAQSGGTLFPDWYKELPGFRNTALIYRVQ